ncbi:MULTISPECIES: CDP-diacylglycerol--serine O-phosphatidyltransferase [Aminobacterium]|jgi:CDP-diacylglycerol--serine O-phosphatidyltransferase|uniref:CDP-diacylglycerol--serine O-phosphatidyltransferase n=1 Tax=Aminobacterium colombiense (strain DSM 12261 / ALA-1) TaxID=572547 RepID=D5ECW7_AMICL|nr:MULTISPECIES: CDP-diacylglycerol--serine O-phosphatidyltransferase [Aminobacterium]MDD2379200.1 CDP-diacylglycerol--serine O-phosphatidyltransferase [Aminobacterium colombiense]ADE56399.1 CDP-diacylglycerol/serineO-phosphatidyl transferase [Aminobacterium colombiense DSM 12261]MDD3767912.1 CDP-diacylglycerol--serine O-phosphatidyltransferase [Aminobacterium colombiense]MDD4265433.1 CDP-diacylglycerol--serine O-phosphatidyltransferase [Aminobacterium colombiense]MDD4586130.1 CDP-diacylglycer
MRKKIGKRHLSFREIAPNMVTSGNLLCGMLSLILTFHGRFLPAAWLIFFAVFFDFMDGKVARSLGGGTQFGLEYDSLADVVSFGVAPAILVYANYLQGFAGVTGALAVCFFALCGALRLARFNIVHVPGPFQGLPIPAGGLFLASFVIGGISVPAALAAFFSVGTGALMISSVPYGNLKGLRKGNTNKKKFLFLCMVTVGLIIVLHGTAPLAAISIYVISGLLRFDWGKWLSLEEDEDTLNEGV